MRTYKPATFQPIVRPDWGGVLSYLSDSEKSEILTAIIKYPSVECDSKFWIETIKPDLDLQYSNFVESCEKKSRGVRDRWGKISITSLQHNNNISNTYVIDAESERESEKEKEEESKNKINKNINNILNNNLYINKIYIDDNFSIPVDDFFNQYRKELGNEIINQVENWIKTTQKGKYVDKQFVCKQFINFAKRQNKPLIRA